MAESVLGGDSRDLVARILAVVLAGMVTIWSTFSARDRFTGEDARVLETRISQVEHHISPAGQAVVHESINNRIHRIEQDIASLPPLWLREDVEEIKRRVEALERDHRIMKHEERKQ
jgi:hypothetical protein